MEAKAESPDRDRVVEEVLKLGRIPINRPQAVEKRLKLEQDAL